MFITTLLTFFVVRHGWGYPLPVALAATGAFLAFDALLVISCALKFADGGWFPLVLGAAIFGLMATWKRGRELLQEQLQRDDPELLPLIESLAREPLPRSPRTAVYAVADPSRAPQALLHNIKHNAVLHERNVVLTVSFRDEPFVPAARAGRGRAARARLLAGARALRLHGDARRAGGARRLRRARPRHQPVRGLVLPEPRDRRAASRRGHGVLARIAVRDHGAQRRQRRRVLPPAGELRGRAGDAGRALGGALSSGDHRRTRFSRQRQLIAATPARCSRDGGDERVRQPGMHSCSVSSPQKASSRRHPAGDAEQQHQ